jgi:hypothetical protein
MKNPKEWFEKLKNNPIIATLIILATIIGALSSFTGSAKNLLSLFKQETRPAINGEWKAAVRYDWQNANYVETFTLAGNGNEVHGVASFLGRKVGIFEGTIKAGKLQFITKTQEMVSSSGDSKEVVHHYQGQVLPDEIKFVMQTDGGFTLHTPIEFTAKK